MVGMHWYFYFLPVQARSFSSPSFPSGIWDTLEISIGYGSLYLLHRAALFRLFVCPPREVRSYRSTRVRRSEGESPATHGGSVRVLVAGSLSIDRSTDGLMMDWLMD